MKQSPSKEYIKYVCNKCGATRIKKFFDASLQDLSLHQECGGQWRKTEPVNREFATDEVAFIRLISRFYYYARVENSGENNFNLEYFAFQVRSLLDHLLVRLECLIDSEILEQVIRADLGFIDSETNFDMNFLAYWKDFIADIEKRSFLKVDKNLECDPDLPQLQGAGGGGK